MWQAILIVDNVLFIILFLWYRHKYRQKLRKLQHLIMHDPLTRLYNRRGFNDLLERVKRTSLRTGKSFSILMIDVDHFKNINDTFGHPVGDLVLQTIATLIERECRASDIACRIGGEEFAVILPDIDSDGALIIAERIRNRIASYRSVTFKDLRMSVSIGIGSQGSVDDLMDRADRNLYIAKKAGRNRTIAR